jgi:hypothetical protein
MASSGWLTPEEEAEVRAAIDLVVGAARRGEISSTFARWLLTQLAEEKAEAWRARHGGGR